jgi:hypothetical protein
MNIFKKICQIKAFIMRPSKFTIEARMQVNLSRIENKLDAINIQLEKLIQHTSLSDSSIQIEDVRSTSKHDLNSQNNQFSYYSIVNKTMVREILDNQFLQIEALTSIYESLPNLKFLPATRGWAASPDFLSKIIEMMLHNKPQLVLEAGSGTSTIVIGLALELIGSGKSISIDHLTAFKEITSKNLQINHINANTQIYHCPLVDYEILSENWKWYDISKIVFDCSIDMLVIDGPPGSIQPFARFPAIPLLSQYFSDRTIILLDDANRNDETIIIKKWIKYLNDHDFKVVISSFKNFEKGLVMLDVTRTK